VEGRGIVKTLLIRDTSSRMLARFLALSSNPCEKSELAYEQIRGVSESSLRRLG
jgi:hypothetical protein